MIDFNLVDVAGSVSVHAFKSEAAAKRYAKKNGLTLAASAGALAIIGDADISVATIDDTLDADDVADVLASLENTDASEVVTLRDVALSFDTVTVQDAVQSVRDSFERRDAFEASNGLSLSEDNSYTRERKRMLANEQAIARLFLALGINASDVIERKVSSNAMFNAKALKKITEIAKYVAGFGSRLEKVTRAFIACALVATDRGCTDITNDMNRRFLCSQGFTNLFSDQELIDYLAEQAHTAMTSGAETQSSQARNVLDVLGLGAIKSVQKNRDAIALDGSHAFFAMFRADFMK
jgi:hypothetical protein